MTNECIPYFEAAYTQKITVHAGYAMTGKTFAGPITTFQGAGPGLAADPLPTNDTGNLISPALPSAGSDVSGVISWDVAQNGKAVLIRGFGTFVPVTVGSGGVTAGDLLAVDAAGKVVLATSTQIIVGKAHSTTAAGQDAIVELYDPRSKA